MSEDAIRVRNVSKRFRRGEQFDSLRDLIAGRVLRRSKPDSGKNNFLALDDVSFDVAPGEAFGIVGPNGAGKSTMLKLLAGIMRPDRGVTTVRGPVSPLIELGAGFHGDLTGRENIFLNASILGMSRATVARQFDEIVEFAGIGEFLDMPVKRYSSGMYARLGFSIAAHAAPRVLLVDEVLSVGDRVFRARCMDKMGEFLARGVAVVFVSHDLSAVTRFCDRTLVLCRGRTQFCGPTAEAVFSYYEACDRDVSSATPTNTPAARVSGVRLCDRNGVVITSIRPAERVRFEFDVDFDMDLARPSFGLSLVRIEDHLTLYETSSTRLGDVPRPARAGDRQCVRYEFDVNLAPGEYAVGLHVRDRDSLVYAVSDAFAAKLLVRGQNTASGLVHIDPSVRVSTQDRSAATPVESMGASPAACSAPSAATPNGTRDSTPNNTPDASPNPVEGPTAGVTSLGVPG